MEITHFILRRLAGKVICYTSFTRNVSPYFIIENESEAFCVKISRTKAFFNLRTYIKFNFLAIDLFHIPLKKINSATVRIQTVCIQTVYRFSNYMMFNMRPAPVKKSKGFVDPEFHHLVRFVIVDHW